MLQQLSRVGGSKSKGRSCIFPKNGNRISDERRGLQCEFCVMAGRH